MLKYFGLILVFVMSLVNSAKAQEDCDCGRNPYVDFEINKPIEIDENSWRVKSVERFDIDLTQEDEPEVCVVYLELIPVTDPILYKDFQIVPVGEFEIFFYEHWVLARDFANQMDASGCDIEGTES